MFIGVLMTCALLTDVTSCDVKMNTERFYENHDQCAAEMRDTAIYASQVMMLVAQPFCFEIKNTI